MIRINLLPIEKRRKERTPLPRFIAMNAAIVACLLLAFLVFQLYKKQGQLQTDLADAKNMLNLLQEEVKPYDELLKEESSITAWISEADKIKNSRPFMWWEKVDELWDVVVNARDVWITSLQAQDTAQGGYKGKNRAAVTASISMNCLSAGSSPDKMTAFRKSLKSHMGLKETFNFGLNEPPQFLITSVPNTKEEFAVKFYIDLSRGVSTTTEKTPKKIKEKK